MTYSRLALLLVRTRHARSPEGNEVAFWHAGLLRGQLLTGLGVRCE